MAYVPPYQPQEQPSGTPALPNTNVPSAAATGLSGLNRNIEESANLLQRGQNYSAMADAYGQLAQAKEDALTSAKQIQDEMPDDPTGYTEKVHAAYSDYANKLLDQTTNVQARRFLQMHLNSFGPQLVRQSANWEASQLQVYRGKQIGQIVDSSAKIVAADPTQFDTEQEAAHSAIDFVGLTPKNREAMREAATKQLQTAANESYLVNNPGAAYADYSKALGLAAKPPALPNPTPTPGSANPAASGPALDPDGFVSQDAALAAVADAKKTGDTSVRLEIKGQGMQTLPVAAVAAALSPTPSPDTPTRVASVDTGTRTDAAAATLPLDPTATPTQATTATGKPFVDSLTTQQLVEYRNRAHAEMLRGQSGARAALERDMQNVETAAKDPTLPPAPDIPRDRFDAAYPDKATADAKYAELGQWQAFGTDLKTMQPMPTGQIQDYVASIKPTDTGAPDFAVRMNRWQATAAAAGHLIDDRAKDPWDALTRQGVIPNAPLDFSTPDALAASFAQRQQITSTLHGVYMSAPITMSKPEAAAFANVLEQAPVAQKISLLGAMRKGLTDDASFRASVGQIRPDAPELAQAAIIGATDPVSEELILRGESVLHPGKAEKTGEGGPGKAPIMPNEQLMQQAYAEQVVDAFRDNQPRADLGYKLFRYAFAGSAARDGALIDTDKTPDPTRVKEALRAALGGTIDWPGGHKVILPRGMPDDAFKPIYRNAWADAMTSGGYDVQEHPIQEYTPVSIGDPGDGNYALSTGTGFLPAGAGQRGYLVVHVPVVPVSGPVDMRTALERFQAGGPRKQPNLVVPEPDLGQATP